MCNFDKDLLKSSLRLRKLFLLFFFLFNKKKQEIDRYSWKLKYYTIISPKKRDDGIHEKTTITTTTTIINMALKLTIYYCIGIDAFILLIFKVLNWNLHIKMATSSRKHFIPHLSLRQSSNISKNLFINS